jgi:hypothetical protein
MDRETGWNLLCKFFDNLGANPHHMHQRDERAVVLKHFGPGNPDAEPLKTRK